MQAICGKLCRFRKRAAQTRCFRTGIGVGSFARLQEFPCV